MCIRDRLDLASMYPNAITCTVLGGVRIPIVMESDKETIQVCIKSCNEIDKSNPRVVRIPNSLHLEHIMPVSYTHLERICIVSAYTRTRVFGGDR